MPKTFIRTLTLSAVLAAPTLLAGPAQAGVTMVMQRGAGDVSTLYVDGDKMRMENPRAAQKESSTVIIDAAGKRMLLIKDAEKSYSEVTEADLKKFGEMMKARRAQMEEHMKSMPPDQRKHMEDMMGGKESKPHELKFEKLGQKKSVNGFSCEMYKVTDDGQPKEEDCLGAWSSGLLQRSDFAGLRKFAEEMAKDSGAAGPNGGKAMFEQFDKYPGFPVTRHPLEPGDHEDEQLKSIKRGSIPASTFAVPAGYKKTESPMGMFGGGGTHRPQFRPAPPLGP